MMRNETWRFRHRQGGLILFCGAHRARTKRIASLWGRRPFCGSKSRVLFDMRARSIPWPLARAKRQTVGAHRNRRRCRLGDLDINRELPAE